jgi:hypothetical protein
VAPKVQITPPLVVDRRLVPTAEGPGHLAHLPGPLGPLCTCIRSVLCSRRPVICALGDAPGGSKVDKKRLMAQLFRLDRYFVRPPPPPRQRPEASETPVGALGATLCMYRVGSKQQPPRRVVPWVMHVEGQKWPKRASYLAVGGGSTPRALRQSPRHLTHLWGH